MEVAGILSYLAGFVIFAGIYSVFALGLNVHWGFTGLFNIGIAGFFALGRLYHGAADDAAPRPCTCSRTSSSAATWPKSGFWTWESTCGSSLGLGAAAAVCGVVALVIGYITLRLRDDYLAIATLGIAETVRLFFLNEKWVANGSKGLVPDPGLPGRPGGPGTLRLPVPRGGAGCPAGGLPAGAAGGQVALGTGAAGHPRGRNRGPSRRQGRVQVQAPSLHPWAR